MGNGFLALAFADADKSKTGKLTVAEFDELCENVASLPRRFGLAPSWEQEYGGSMEKRLASRKKCSMQLIHCTALHVAGLVLPCSSIGRPAMWPAKSQEISRPGRPLGKWSICTMSQIMTKLTF